MLESVDIKAGKLTKSTDGGQIVFGESRIAKEHFDKCAVKCKGEVSMLAALKITDMRK
jgi:hypothetical protein